MKYKVSVYDTNLKAYVVKRCYLDRERAVELAEMLMATSGVIARVSFHLLL